MAYKIATCATFMSDLVAAPKKIQKKLKDVMNTLQQTPNIQRGKLTKKLAGYSSLWRYALEDPEYRIIYEVDEHQKAVRLLMMGPRKDGEIYKRLHWVPDKGPLIIPVEVTPVADPDYVFRNPEVLQPAPQPQQPAASGTPLRPMDDENLKQWAIDERYWQAIKDCRAEDELLNADLPQHVKLRIMDCLWPSPIERVISQPSYVIENEEDLLEKAADGELSKLLLNLDLEQLKAMNSDMGWPILVKGGPGTGKSVVSLYKAASLVKDRLPGGSPTILFTTFTNSLINSARTLFQTYLGEQCSQIEVRTINGVATRILNDISDNRADFLTGKDRRQIISELLDGLDDKLTRLPGQVRDTDYISDEFEWVIEGWGLASLNEYKQKDRPGRRIALGPSQREQIWELYEAFKRKVHEMNKLTHESCLNMALKRVREASKNGERKNNPPRFDYVFVDEAQDLKPVGLRLCAALASEGKNLYLTADMNQSIYGKGGISWTSVDEALQFRGRTRILKKSYRSTDQSLRGAKELLQGLENLDDETVEVEPVYLGPKPKFCKFQDEKSRNESIVEWINTNLSELRLSRSCAAILCPTQRLVDEMLVAMQKLGLPCIKFGGNTWNLDQPSVKIMTMHSSKGLEFPIVVLPDFRENAFKFLEPQDDSAMVDIAKRLYFVACTRAMKRLMVARVGLGDDNLTKLLTTGNWIIEQQ
jgi:superfamily I DNA/RNA helicase/mRNA-degrading endonuclease RelE of RelBE toxin-antitoxin system